MIIKAGIEMLRDNLSLILGERVEFELSTDIKKTIVSFPEVQGAYDLLLHNYGPDRYIGSVHIEVPDNITIYRLDQLEREIVSMVYEEHGVAIEGISIYSQNSDSSKAGKLRNSIARKLVEKHETVKQIHGFYLDDVKNIIAFDMVVSFKEPDRQKLHEDVVFELKSIYPEYEFHINMDRDFSD